MREGGSRRSRWDSSGPVVCRTDCEPPWSVDGNGRRFTCTEPPPPYTAVDNQGYFDGSEDFSVSPLSPAGIRSPPHRMRDLPQYQEVTATSLPQYCTLPRQNSQIGTAASATDPHNSSRSSNNPNNSSQTVSFSTGVIGPETVGGEVPAALIPNPQTPNRRQNLPTRPTLSGYGANTVTIAFGSAYEPPPTYDISIIARPSQPAPPAAAAAPPRQNQHQQRDTIENQVDLSHGAGSSGSSTPSQQQPQPPQQRQRQPKPQLRVNIPQSHDASPQAAAAASPLHHNPRSPQSPEKEDLRVHLPSTSDREPPANRKQNQHLPPSHNAPVPAPRQRLPSRTYSRESLYEGIDNPIVMDPSSETSV